MPIVLAGQAGQAVPIVPIGQAGQAMPIAVMACHCDSVIVAYCRGVINSNTLPIACHNGMLSVCHQFD